MPTCRWCDEEKDPKDGYWQCGECYIRDRDEQREKRNRDIRDSDFQLRDAHSEIGRLLRIIQRIQVISREVLIHEDRPDTSDVI